MPRRLFLRDSQPGDILEDVLVLSGKQLGATAQGKPYIKAFVSDRTCQMMARMWNASKEIFNALPESGFVKIRGRVENYQGNNQFIIEQAWQAKDGTYDAGELMPQTSKNINEMCARLHELCGSIQNRHLGAVIQAYLDDEALMNNFCKAPAAMTFHHAFLGGLLEHTLNAMEVGNCIVQFYPGLNRDLLLAGIFLHDIAKTWELSYDASFGYTDGGHLIGHIVKSAMWVEEKARTAAEQLGEPIPRELVEVLQHIILSHHDKAEFGSPKAPATPEAIAVHMIENMDAKLTMALTCCRGDGAGEGSWTEYMKALGGRLYRPDVAPADAAEIDRAEIHRAQIDAASPAERGANGTASTKIEAGDGRLKISNPLFETATQKL
ncbi:MAG TPA: HD domain-containing protein [Tepidisphaeraceae bacterium]|nr:HD domain-containing protein [Tepidisphaeraceae bacterium]